MLFVSSKVEDAVQDCFDVGSYPEWIGVGYEEAGTGRRTAIWHNWTGQQPSPARSLIAYEH